MITAKHIVAIVKKSRENPTATVKEIWHDVCKELGQVSLASGHERGYLKLRALGLAHRESEILLLLMTNERVRKDDLRAVLSHEGYSATDALVKVYMNRLRTALEGFGVERSGIITLPSYGYAMHGVSKNLIREALRKSADASATKHPAAPATPVRTTGNLPNRTRTNGYLPT